jgi:gas vesicle protein
MSGKQQRKLLKHNYDKMKEDADELVALARALQEDIEKSSENVLSLQVVEKAEKIEKLAKRIKNTARGF